MNKGYQKGLSFEFFPPKTNQSKEKLLKEIALLKDWDPDYVSVTYGAGGSTRDGTIETVKSLQQHFGPIVAPHLSCIGAARSELIQVIKTYQNMGTKQIVALRGDSPPDLKSRGELHYAYELVQLIRDETQNHFHVDVAAYPECHPMSANFQDDILNLKKKMDAGANAAITQYFFHADAYFYFLDVCSKNQITIPITPGIMPITSYEKLMRFSKACGADLPQWIRRNLESYGDQTEKVKTFGVELVYRLCERLLAGGAPGLHFYTLNQAAPSLAILDQLPVLHHLKVMPQEKKAI